MKRHAWSIFSAVVVIVAAGNATLLAQQTADVAGEWGVWFDGPQGMVNLVLLVEQEGGELSGELHGPMGEQELTGKVDGDEVTFSVAIESPQGTFELKFSGKVEGPKMSGKMEAGEGQFTADWWAERKEGG